MREDFKPVYKAFVDKFGEQSQRLQCIEEMSELIKELCKLDRFVGTDKEDDIVAKIREELADVHNMVEQLEYIYGENEIESIRASKIERSTKLYLNEE